MAVPNRHEEIFKKSQLFIDFTFILFKKLTIFLSAENNFYVA
jgi:hypothetical protein